MLNDKSYGSQTDEQTRIEKSLTFKNNKRFMVKLLGYNKINFHSLVVLLIIKFLE